MASLSQIHGILIQNLEDLQEMAGHTNRKSIGTEEKKMPNN
jgi:hypothetical protein